MTHAMVTIISPLAGESVSEAEARIEKLGNPARDNIRAALDTLEGGDGTHFCSLHAVRSKDLGKAYLVFEFSADGGDEEATSRIARAIGDTLATVFSLASDWVAETQIGVYLLSHRISIGVGLFDSPGLHFAGTPGMSVGRIRAESRLAAAVTTALESLQTQEMWALQRLQAVRDRLRTDPELADMLETATGTAPFSPPGTVALIAQLAGSFCTTYLWPIGVMLALLMLYGGTTAGSIGNGFGFWAGASGFLLGALKWLIVSGFIALVVATATLLIGYGELRSLEDRDSLDGQTADPKTLAEMFKRENRFAQNHMISVTQRKPGAIRWFTARFVFWIIGEFATKLYEPGFLSNIGTIHFARWVTVPATRDVLFFSNYDASWESYLEDFITKAHGGLTGVWSNCVGFPRTENLFQKGATDGERFKRYARQSMSPTRFWYSAYPRLTTTSIRINALIRRGLSGALTEDEAMAWLALFGSAQRPTGTLLSSEIQSLIFGGMKFMPFGTCVFYNLPSAPADARVWLADVMPKIGFNDGRRLKLEAVATLALSGEGLQRLGLPKEGLRTFPYAFLSGMTQESRARILGDTGLNAKENWRWGKTTPHAAMLVYGKTAEDVAVLETELGDSARKRGVELVHRVPLKKLTDDRSEPFGFADGISQPLIRGTYKALKAADPIHIVEPGEFILGYPDNRDNIPPGPTLPPTADPRNVLPLVAQANDFSRNYVDGMRDLGLNGSFLVIRELEQNVEAFEKYCDEQARLLKGTLPEPYEVTPQFIGAKLVGRWQSGSSLVRHPYLPKEPHLTGAETPSQQSTPETERLTTLPLAAKSTARPVERPAKASHLQDNDFLFGTEDPEALRCPFGAHIRRANPRDSLDPGSQEQIDISNRHRIMRIGRQFVPQMKEHHPGLLFMCLNADLERQFEFVQQTWLSNPSFHGLSGEQDPLLSNEEVGTCGFTIATRYGPRRLGQVPQMVTTKGGGYFFLPGKRLLEFLTASA